MFWMLVLDILKTISVPAVVAAVIAVCIAHSLGKRQRLYEMRSGVLRELVGRRANWDDAGFLIALNSIPIVFHDKEDIKTAWKEYHDAITELAKEQSDLGSFEEGREEELINLAHQQFIVLALAICESLNIKAKENDVLLVFK